MGRVMTLQEFARRLAEARDLFELAIDGFYRTIDDLEESLCARPVQAWLEGETLMISAIG